MHEKTQQKVDNFGFRLDGGKPTRAAGEAGSGGETVVNHASRSGFRLASLVALRYQPFGQSESNIGPWVA